LLSLLEEEEEKEGEWGNKALKEGSGSSSGVSGI
jgi:hypothetical protein